MKHIIALILGIFIILPAFAASANENNQTLEEKAQSIANELVNTYGITTSV